MSIQSELTRIQNKRDLSFQEVANKGVTVPAGSTIDDLPGLISSIETGGEPYVMLTGERDASGGKILYITGSVNEAITPDSGGGDIDIATANILIDLSDDTIEASKILSGCTGHDSMARPIVGTYVAPVIGTKEVSYTPTTAVQTETIMPDSGDDVMSSVDVTIGAIPSEYVVPSGTLSITQNGLGIDVKNYEAVDVNVGGIMYATGSYTPSETYKTTANRAIVTLAEIGFTPTRFIMYVKDKTQVSGIQYAVIYTTFDSAWPIRVTVRYTNTSGTSGASPSQASWTTQTNNQLYMNGTTVYFRTVSSYILPGNVEYTWEAYG